MKILQTRPPINVTVNYGDGSGEQVAVSEFELDIEDDNVCFVRFGLERTRAICGLTSTSCLADIGSA